MLIFAPHPDDEVLGVGGTIAKRASQGWKIVDCIVTSDENYNTRRNYSWIDYHMSYLRKKYIR